MTEQQAEDLALLSGRRARWVYFFIVEAVTFFSMVAISPSWMGVFDTHFIGPCVSTMLANSIPFLIPSSDRQAMKQDLADSERQRVELLAQIRANGDIVRDPNAKQEPKP